jgi:hypothetical protein
MANVSIPLEDSAKSRLEKFSWVNWSDLGREVAVENLRREERFKKFDELLKNSEMTDELAKQFADELKAKVAKRHGVK